MNKKEELIALKAKLELLDELGNDNMLKDGMVTKAVFKRMDLVNKIESIESAESMNTGEDDLNEILVGCTSNPLMSDEEKEQAFKIALMENGFSERQAVMVSYFVFTE